ncbi:MAG TPA: DUF58 domain-containing protein [Methylococcaceae bacterium]|nr:DUF58 domain-containing protein [Methylococcaceae bacterium]
MRRPFIKEEGDQGVRDAAVGLTWRERFDPRRFLRGEKAGPAVLVLGHRRVFILPTRRGLGFALLLVLQLLISTNYNINLGFALAFLLGSMAMTSILHAFRNLSGLSVHAGHAQPVFAGETALPEIVLDNADGRRRFRIEVSCRKQIVATLDLTDAEARHVPIPCPALRRGWLALDTVTLATTFPLGLFRAWAPLNLPVTVLVYPKPLDAPLPLPESGRGEEGDSRPLGRGDDFAGLRDYQFGDSPRHIHWKGYAKGQGLHTRVYAAQAARDLWLDYAEAPAGGVEDKLSVLCRWLLDAERAGRRYGLRLPGTTLAPDAGEVHLHACLSALALFSP